MVEELAWFIDLADVAAAEMAASTIKQPHSHSTWSLERCLA